MNADDGTLWNSVLRASLSHRVLAFLYWRCLCAQVTPCRRSWALLRMLRIRAPRLGSKVGHNFPMMSIRT